MKILHVSKKIFFTLLLFLVSANLYAETKWQIATVFLGKEEDIEFQKDIDQNILELSTLSPSKFLNLAIYRELPEKTYHYFPGVKAIKEVSLGELLSDNRLLEYKIPGQFSLTARQKLLATLKKSFNDPNAKKVLILYGHGLGPLGMKGLSVNDLKKLLSDLNIKLDILWFDACFMANLELLYQLRSFSSFTVASEEAEFSSGLPFENLSDLPKYENAKEAAIMMAKSFIDSYSYIKNGKQKIAVTSSSATVSVIDNSEVKNFSEQMVNVKKIIDQLTPIDQSTLKKRLSRHFNMDQADLVDLGSLLIELRLLNKNPKDDFELTRLIRLLNIESVKKLKTNPRVHITLPNENANMVFGFNDWKNGFKSEFEENSFFSEIINAKDFTQGPENEFWPVKKFNSRTITISPFAPGINSFQYYFIDKDSKKISGDIHSIKRSFDIVEDFQVNKKEGSFIVYTAYTQRIGKKAERYTGVNLTNINTTPSLDYYELDFNQLVKWQNL